MDDAIRCSVKLNNSRCEGTYYRSSSDDSSELLCVNGILKFCNVPVDKLQKDGAM